ncbi:hypothetical protein M0811_03741 [Anaeramoeba ignava]|uniref:Transmembrane protein n=1 Tax=Anaeramoeba ignava TaxID=1746090 RepID=A0A9Q0LWR3_ANAIG|nr:hypothetical protein M0811_03741 [Anaeramoeba ignava]
MLLSPQFWILILLIILVSFLTLFFSIVEFLVKGLRFFVPPQKDRVEEILKEKNSQTQSHLKIIEAPLTSQVLEHLRDLHYNSLESLLFWVFLSLAFTLISEVLQFFKPQFYSTLPVLINFFAIVISLYFFIKLVITKIRTRVDFWMMLGFSLISFAISFVIISSDNQHFDLHVRDAFEDSVKNAVASLGYTSDKLISWNSFKISIAFISTVYSALALFAILQSTKAHYYVVNTKTRFSRFARLRSYINFFLPLIVVILYTQTTSFIFVKQPLIQQNIQQNQNQNQNQDQEQEIEFSFDRDDVLFEEEILEMENQENKSNRVKINPKILHLISKTQIFSQEQFATFRVMFIYFVCILKLFSYRNEIQSILFSAIASLKKFIIYRTESTAKTAILKTAFIITRIWYFSIQILVPTILNLFLIIFVHLSGGFNFGLLPHKNQPIENENEIEFDLGDQFRSFQQVHYFISQFFTTKFCREIFLFFIFWNFLTIFLASLIGIVAAKTEGTGNFDLNDDISSLQQEYKVPKPQDSIPLDQNKSKKQKINPNIRKRKGKNSKQK